MEPGDRRLSGAFSPRPLPVVESLGDARAHSRQMQPFGLQPRGTGFTVFESTATHAMPAHGTSWTQQYAQTPRKDLSTRYTDLFRSMQSATALTRANKALVAGTGGAASTKPAQSAMTAASLMRLNETTTAFGSRSVGSSTHDVGTGLMAEALAQKWHGKTTGDVPSAPRLLNSLVEKYPQLDSVKRMREQGGEAIGDQIAASRMAAAQRARERGQAKGVDDLDAYVAKKFAKHGLGPVPEHTPPAEPSASYDGGLAPASAKRLRSMKEVTRHVAQDDAQPFQVRPGASASSTYEGTTTHIAPSHGTVWAQLVAMPSENMSTQYANLFPALRGVSDLTRANKALVRGGSDTLSPARGENTWHGKSYSPAAQTTATLFRVNESTTAFGADAMRSPERDVGAGIMAETLSLKWQAKNRGQTPDMREVGAALTRKFPQLDSVKSMRGQGSEALIAQVADSRMAAAVSAAQRGRAKGKSDINEYVQRKFAKHGLGEVPKGWAARFRSL